jgi:hypothetical protein
VRRSLPGYLGFPSVDIILAAMESAF